MSALIPAPAVCIVYRRYLKSATKIPNSTIRLLLIQQIRAGFRRNTSVFTPEAQRELINQSFKDLHILEDERLSRTLFINRVGMVSSIDWEVRRVQYNFSEDTMLPVMLVTWLFMGMMIYAFLTAQRLENTYPELNDLVFGMRLRLEGSNPEEIVQKREKDVRNQLEQRRTRDELECRILSNFQNIPESVREQNLQELKVRNMV